MSFRLDTVLHALPRSARTFLRGCANILFPPVCLACNELVEQQGALCSECWNQMEFCAGPACDICGYPFEYQMEHHTICGACIQQPPPYGRARAVFRYNSISRQLVTSLKYHDKTHIVPYIADWMVRAGEDILADADYIIPVPLHRRRLWMRRYNQSALLSQHITRKTSVPTLYNALVRTRYTPPQAGLNYKQRIKNVTGAFQVIAKYRFRIKGKRIILIDDVLTTGATVKACARALLKVGAQRVDVLTLGQTVKGDNDNGYL